MRPSLVPGLTYEVRFRVPKSKTVPNLYPEAPEFREMPEVFATGFMVGLVEWAAMKAIEPHLDWPAEQSVGTHINVSHVALTPPGLEVRARARLIGVEGRRLTFEVEAHDERELIGKGTHERFVIDKARFSEKARRKAEGA
jgi:fluoroacetyl-CoA thioesterase